MPRQVSCAGSPATERCPPAATRESPGMPRPRSRASGRRPGLRRRRASEVIGDPIAPKFARAHQRRSDLGMQGEVTGDDRVSPRRARRRHRSHRTRVVASLRVARRPQRRSPARSSRGNSAINQKVDVGRIDAVLEEAGGRRARRELARRKRLVRVDVADLGITSAQNILNTLRDRIPLRFGSPEGFSYPRQHRLVVEGGVRNNNRRPSTSTYTEGSCGGLGSCMNPQTLAGISGHQDAPFQPW